jgi:hypothetical protein
MERKKADEITIGLFGTCGNSQWRVPFIEHFQKEKIEYFNPVVPDWNPSCAEIEAEHLVEDEIILFPVTDETYGGGSLAEVGFSITQALKSNSERFVVIYVAPKVSDKLREENAALAKESDRARALCLAHLRKQKHKYPNVYIVENLADMLKATKHLYDAMLSMKKARSFTM